MENNEDKYMVHFDIISLAGAARSNAMEAIQDAENGSYEESLQLLKEARASLVEAHGKMFKMLQEEANGKPIEMNIVAVHAQDHISMATVMIDLGEAFVRLAQRVENK